MKLLQLKDEAFYYCDKKYVVKRYVTPDFKFLFTTDSLDYCKAYKANEEGKGELINEIYHKLSYHSYPIYELKEIVEKVIGIIDTPFTLKINQSQFNTTAKKVII